MKQKENHSLAFFAVILAAVLGGGIPVLGKIGLSIIPPFTFTFLRFLLATLFILPLFVKERSKFNKDTGKIVLLSLLATANVTLFAFGVKLTTATISQMLYTTVPIIAGIFSYFILKEKFTIRKSIGVLLGFIGVLIIILLPVYFQKQTISGNLIGNLIIAIAVVSFSLYSVITKKFQKQFSPIYLTTIFSMTTGFIMLFLAGYEFVVQPSWIHNLSLMPILSVLYVGFFGGFVYYLLYQYAIKNGTPVIASMTLFIQPVATFIWAFLLLGERLTTGVIIGAVFVLLGAGIVTLKK